MESSRIWMSCAGVEEDALRAYFSSRFGAVNDLYLPRSRDGSRKGYGFVEFESEEAATVALASGEEHTVEGQLVRINAAKPRSFGSMRTLRPGGPPQYGQPALAAGEPGPWQAAQSGLQDPRAALAGPYPAQDTLFALPPALAVGRALTPEHQLSPGMEAASGAAKGRGPRLYVGGVPTAVSETMVRQHFTRWGRVLDVYFPKDRASGRRRPFCFVTFGTREAAESAAAQSNREVGGHAVTAITLVGDRPAHHVPVLPPHMQGLPGPMPPALAGALGGSALPPAGQLPPSLGAVQQQQQQAVLAAWQQRLLLASMQQALQQQAEPPAPSPHLLSDQLLLEHSLRGAGLELSYEPPAAAYNSGLPRYGGPPLPAPGGAAMLPGGGLAAATQQRQQLMAQHLGRLPRAAAQAAPTWLEMLPRLQGDFPHMPPAQLPAGGLGGQPGGLGGHQAAEAFFASQLGSGYGGDLGAGLPSFGASGGGAAQLPDDGLGSFSPYNLRLGGGGAAGAEQRSDQSSYGPQQRGRTRESRRTPY